jgi:hypothetical protein
MAGLDFDSDGNGVACTNRGEVLVYDGVEWISETTIYDPSGQPTPLLHVWADDGQAWFGGRGFLHHWDGTAVASHPMPDGSFVDEIWGRSGTDIYLRSRSPTDVLGRKLWHFDGTTIEIVPVPQLDNPNNVLLAIDGSEDAVAAASNHGISILSGDAWEFHPTTFIPSYISMFSPEHLYAVSPAGTLFRFDGTTWHPTAAANSPSTLWAVDPWTVILGSNACGSPRRRHLEPANPRVPRRGLERAFTAHCARRLAIRSR